jgi:hypothetical protein
MGIVEVMTPLPCKIRAACLAKKLCSQSGEDRNSAGQSPWQEADETQLWLELLAEDCKIDDSQLPVMHREAGEIIAIFTTIVSKTRKNL